MGDDISIEIYWKKYIEGNKEVFGDIYLHYYPDLYAYGKTITPDIGLIDSAIQELFIGLWRTTPRDIRSLDQYVFISFRNQVYRLHKIKRKYFISNQTVDLQEEVVMQKSAEDLVIEDEANSEVRHQIQKALESLPSRRREAIYLKFFQNKSTAEISVIMNIREEMVRNYIYKGIKALRAHYSDQLFLLLSIQAFLISLFIGNI